MIGKHLLGVYHKSTLLKHALTHLKDGFEKNQLCLLITDSYSKQEIHEKIIKQWKIDNSKSLEGQNIFIRSTRDWYFPDGTFSPKKVLKLWKEWTKLAQEMKLKGLCVFADMSSFFDRSFVKKLFNYEHEVGKQVIPSVTFLCAYTYEDLDAMPSSVLESLKSDHDKAYLEEEELNRRLEKALRADKSHSENLSKN